MLESERPTSTRAAHLVGYISTTDWRNLAFIGVFESPICSGVEVGAGVDPGPWVLDPGMMLRCEMH